MEFAIPDPEDITLPGWLPQTDLTLAEIGALVCLASLREENMPALEARTKDPKNKEAFDAIKARNLVTTSLEGKNLSIQVDLDKLQPKNPQTE